MAEFTNLGENKKKYKASGDTSFKNVARSFGQGLTFGSADEIVGALSKAKGNNYREARDRERAEYEAYVDKHPWLALGGEAIGGALPALASAFIPGGQVGTASYLARLGSLGNRALKTAQALDRARQPARLIATGATMGGLSGVGAAKEMSDIPVEVAKGAAVGAIAAPAISKGLEKGTKLISNTIKHSSPNSFGFANREAQRRVLADVGQSGETVDTLYQKMLVDQALGHNTQLWNMSPILQQRALGISTKPSAGMKRLQEEAWKNQFGAKENVVNRINKDLASEGGIAINPTLRKAELEVQHSKAAKEAYDKYMGMKFKKEDLGHLESMLNEEPIKNMLIKHHDEVSKLHKSATGKDLPSLFKVNKDGQIIRDNRVKLTPDQAEFVKKALDVRADAGFAGSTADKSTAPLWAELRNKWRNATAEASKDANGVSLAAEARRAYGEGKNIEEAIEYGQKKLRTTDPTELQSQMYGSKGTTYSNADRPFAVESDVLGTKIAPMTDAERQAVQLGYVQNLRNTLLNKKQNVNAYAEVLSPNEQERIALLMKTDPEKANNLINYLLRGREIYSQSANLTGGSKTAHALAAREDMGHEIGLGDALSSVAQDAINFGVSPMQGGAQIVKKGLNKFIPTGENYNRNVENEMANILTRSTPEMKAFIDASKKRVADDVKISTAGNALNTAGTAGGIGGIRQHALDETGYVDTSGDSGSSGGGINSQWVIQ